MVPSAFIGVLELNREGRGDVAYKDATKTACSTLLGSGRLL